MLIHKNQILTNRFELLLGFFSESFEVAMRSSLVLLLVVAAHALVPTAPRGISMRQPAVIRPAVPSVATPRAAPPQMVGTLSKLAAVPVMYALMSVNEYATHRWYQHEEFNRDHGFQRFCQRVANFLRRRPLTLPDGRRNMIKVKGGGHVEHHAETYDDMSLKKDPRWRKTKAAASLDSDEFRGTAFSWAVTGLMTVQMLPTALPTFALMGFSLLQSFAVLLPGMMVHALVWNMLHPPMHGLPAVTSRYGAPRCAARPELQRHPHVHPDPHPPRS